ncbi:MAG: DUF6261 family protein [Bacteroidales bacterium]|nr:DUF6261 family protein [Bacteroidales bacterium]
MITLNKIISTSRTTEIDASSIRLIGVYNKRTGYKDVNLDSIFVDLKQESANLTTAINRDKVLSELNQKDAVRDACIQDIYYILLGALRHPEPTVMEAAEIVHKVFAKYGVSMAGKSYASQTSLVLSMLEDLTASELQSSVALISGLKQVVNALQTAQDNFEQARIKHDEQKIALESKSNASTIKKTVVDIINNQLVVYLRAMVLVKEKEYSDFTRLIATIIDDNNEAVKRRSKKLSADDSEAEDEL